MELREPGFYWARRKDGGELTVIEFHAMASGGNPFIMLIGNLMCPDEEELAEWFDIICRIPEPATSSTPT